MNEIKINEIDGFYFGEAEDFSVLTGCTVIISEEGAVGGVCVAGGAPATRETDLLDSSKYGGESECSCAEWG